MNDEEMTEKSVKYNYAIYSFLGMVEATDMRDALKRSLDNYLKEINPPYINEEYERLDIRVERLEAKK